MQIERASIDRMRMNECPACSGKVYEPSAHGRAKSRYCGLALFAFAVLVYHPGLSIKVL